MNELKNRGVQDILLAVVDGLKGFPEAINATFPETVVQTCIVHLIRHSMNFASWKDRKHVAKALRDVYRAKDADAGLAALDAFEAGPWGEKYPAIAQSWRRNWEHVSPFFVFPESVRRIVYTTNAIESLNAKIRRAVRTRGHFPSDEAASKLLYLVFDHAAEAWKRPPREWFEAKTQFAVIFGERFVAGMRPGVEVLKVDVPNARETLWTAEQGLGCPSFGAVIVEIWGDPPAVDFTATKRLALRSEARGVPCWLLRRFA